MLEGQFVFTALAVLFSFGISIYSIYLNYKQAKVEKLMKILIDEIKAMHNTIKEK